MLAAIYSLIKTNPPIISYIHVVAIYSLIKTNPPIITLLGTYNIHAAVHRYIIIRKKKTNVVFL